MQMLKLFPASWPWRSLRAFTGLMLVAPVVFGAGKPNILLILADEIRLRSPELLRRAGLRDTL